MDLVNGWFLLALVLVVAAYDFWLLFRYGVESTVSRSLRRWAEAWPLFPYLVAFAFGGLFGHLFL